MGYAKRTDSQLCSVCDGDGVVKIPGGISTCDHCHGECYEPRGKVLARLVRAVDGYFAVKGSGDEGAWLLAFNELMAALAEAKRTDRP